MTGLEAVLMTIIAAATPLLLAAIGELVAERSGVLNLGVEGMMIMGAIGGFAAAYVSGSALLGVAAAVGAGVGLSLHLRVPHANPRLQPGGDRACPHPVRARALGAHRRGVHRPSRGVKLPPLHVPGLSDLPLVGPVIFGQDVIVYASVALTALVGWVLARTRLGLVIRATGGNHHSAHALGYNVIAVRYACIAFGGATAGLAGGYLSLVYTPSGSRT